MANSPAEETVFKQTQADVLTREIDTNEFIPELRQLTTDNKSVTGAINYLHGQYKTAILNANTAQRVANDAKAVVDAFMVDPPKNGKSAFEIANELQPEGFKYRNEQEWLDSLEEVRESTIEKAIQKVPMKVTCPLLKSEKLTYRGSNVFPITGTPNVDGAILFVLNGLIYFDEADVVYDKSQKTFTWKNKDIVIADKDRIMALYSEDV